MCVYLHKISRESGIKIPFDLTFIAETFKLKRSGKSEHLEKQK